MKSLINKLIKSNLFILIRNSFNIKPIHLKTYEEKYSTTVSDAFLWRTDDGYKTKFKYSDILNLFYKIKDSWVEFHFYSKKNELIKIEKVDNLNLSNEIEINSKYLNGLEDYGTFYVYHYSKNTENLSDKEIICNRCYVGYAQNNNLFSFVHGNTLSRSTNINANGNISSDIVKTSLFKNQTYTIQKYFSGFDKNELFFSNPTSKIIKFSIENKNFELKPNYTLLIYISSSIITINSNCMFFRPTIFSYKDSYMDVHHS